jgi:hypothetical protein
MIAWPVPRGWSCLYIEALAPKLLARDSKSATTCSKKASSPNIKATSVIGSFKILAISSTKRCTIDLPAIGISGLGIVKVCISENHVLPLVLLFSLNLSFWGTKQSCSLLYLFFINYFSYRTKKVYFTPVLPKPPLSVWDNLYFSPVRTFVFCYHHCAMRSPFSITKKHWINLLKLLLFLRDNRHQQFGALNGNSFLKSHFVVPRCFIAYRAMRWKTCFMMARSSGQATASIRLALNPFPLMLWFHS